MTIDRTAEAERPVGSLPPSKFLTGPLTMYPGEVDLTRRRLALLVLNVAGLLVIAGSFYDLLVPTVPPNHLSFLAPVGQLDDRIAALDLGMLRAIGGCLLAIGITALILTNGPIRRGESWARLTLLVLVGVAEGNNAYQMYQFDSPWYGPLTFVALTGLGVALARAPSPRKKPARLDASVDP